MLKAIIRENLGASAAAGRDLSALSFLVSPDSSLGPTITKSFAWKKVIDALIDVVNTSRQQGTDLYFSVGPYFTGSSGITTIGMRFETRIGQPGTDHSLTSGSPITFSKPFGNLENPVLEYSFTDEATVVIAAGQGEESYRVTSTVTGSRVTASTWNRIELFADARHLETAAGVQNRAQEMLEANRPWDRFTGSLKDTTQTVFGKDWDYGDRVIAEYAGLVIEGVIRGVQVSVNEVGQETVNARFEVEL